MKILPESSTGFYFIFLNLLVNSENHVLCYLKFSSSLESLIACSHLFSLRLSIKMLSLEISDLFARSFLPF